VRQLKALVGRSGQSEIEVKPRHHFVRALTP
jgi:hypothetical protein